MIKIDILMNFDQNQDFSENFDQISDFSTIFTASNIFENLNENRDF